MNCTEKTPKVIWVKGHSGTSFYLLSDWSAGSTPFCKQTEINITPFEKKKNFLAIIYHFLMGFHFGVII